MATPNQKGGFNCEFVQKPQEAFQSECPVCLQILREPFQAPCCGNSFCKVCIERIKTDNKPCPTCNERNLITFHNKGLQRSLYGFQVYCSYKQDGCEWKGELGQLDNHLKKCNPTIACDFHHVGCDLKLPRKDMPAHLKENLVTHMSLQAAGYKQLQEKVNKLENENETLKHQLSTVIPLYGYVEITMANFEQHKRDDDQWFSPPFYTHQGGYKFCLEVYANGNGDGKDTHISVFSRLMKGEFDDHLKWSFRGDITIQLVDQEGGKEHCTKTINYNDETPDTSVGRVTQGDKNDGWGYSQFLSHDELEPEYLKNDCLRFRVTKIKLNN